MYNTNKKKTRGKEIITATLMFLLVGCAVPPEDWHKVKAPPQNKEFVWIQAGFFNIDNSLYSQHCDSGGNQIWMKWDVIKELWKKVKYNTLGCKDGESATGPDA